MGLVKQTPANVGAELGWEGGHVAWTSWTSCSFGGAADHAGIMGSGDGLIILGEGCSRRSGSRISLMTRLMVCECVRGCSRPANTSGISSRWTASWCSVRSTREPRKSLTNDGGDGERPPPELEASVRNNLGGGVLCLADGQQNTSTGVTPLIARCLDTGQNRQGSEGNI